MYKRSLSCLVLVMSWFSAWLADAITCPSLSCAESIIDSSCYLHDNKQPVININGYACSSGQMWNMDIASGEWAWIQEENQNRTTGVLGQSIVERKRIKGQCFALDLYSRSLNNGRQWANDYQCISTKCSGGVCVGQATGSVWKTHSDCDANLYCKTSTTWPYLSTCTALVTFNEECTDNYSCNPYFFWWFATANDKSSNTKRCIERYAKPDNFEFGWGTSLDTSMTDQEYNGIHCTSGLAYQNSSNTNQAICISAANITQSGSVIASPYQCDPSDNSVPCQINYGSGSSDFITVACACSLSGQTGYCSKIPGTTEFKNMTNLRRRGYIDSVWHTLDRDNYLALKDSCGNLKDHATWYEMYYQNFRLLYWPYMQVSAVSSCFQSFIAFSPTNYENSAMNVYSLVMSGFFVMICILILQ